MKLLKCYQQYSWYYCGCDDIFNFAEIDTFVVAFCIICCEVQLLRNNGIWIDISAWCMNVMIKNKVFEALGRLLQKFQY